MANFKMDRFIENSGLDLIGIKIFRHLSIEDKFNCSMVSKSWQKFISETMIETCLQYQALQNLMACNCWRCENKVGLAKVMTNVEELLLKSVLKGWPQLFRYLFPFAKRAGVDFDAPLPNIEQEPYKRRPLLHNLVCTEHCDSEILEILLFELKVDVNRKDGNGYRAVELAISQIPALVESNRNDPSKHRHIRAVLSFLERRDFDYEDFTREKQLENVNVNAFNAYVGKFWVSIQPDQPFPHITFSDHMNGHCLICTESKGHLGRLHIRNKDIASHFGYLPFHGL